MYVHIGCNLFESTVYLSKPNTSRTKEKIGFREVSELERFYMYSRYREQDLKHIQFREGSRLQRVRFREVPLYTVTMHVCIM